MFFSVPVISQINSKGGWQTGGGWGRWVDKGRLKHPFGLKQQCCSFCMWNKLIKSKGWAKIAVRSSLVPHAVLLMPLRVNKYIFRFNSIDKMSLVKADLATHGQVPDVSG